MTFEIYKLEWILSRHTFGNTTHLRIKSLDCTRYAFFNKQVGSLQNSQIIKKNNPD